MLVNSDVVAMGTLPLIAQPHTSVHHLMLATAMLIDSPIDIDPSAKNPALANCFDMPDAGLILTGTRCRRPVMTREVTTVGYQVRRDAIVVRTADERGPTRATFDIHLLGAGLPLLGYRLWMSQPIGGSWLIPTTCDQPFLRLDPAGLDMQDEPPFGDEIDQRRGFAWAKQYLSIAAEGWL